MSQDAKKSREATDADELALAQRLKEAREYLGVSQEWVAQALAIPRASVSALETGKRKVSSSELRKLAALYHVSINDLLGEAKDVDSVERALYRATRDLSEEDRRQVLRFASFLRNSGQHEDA